MEQADLFIKTVKLSPGDLPPVLDIEEKSKIQSTASLIVGLKRWIKKIEDHYGVKPIIYSSSNFYSAWLKKEFGDYPLWVANYNPNKEPIKGKISDNTTEKSSSKKKKTASSSDTKSKKSKRNMHNLFIPLGAVLDRS